MPDERSSDAADIWARMQEVYAGFLAGDPQAVDALLADDVTIWDSDEFALRRGLAELQELRSHRPTDAAVTVTALDATDPVIDVWGDTALLRHLVHVRKSDGTTDVVRNTSVWRRAADGWHAVHNHEDVAGGGGRP